MKNTRYNSCLYEDSSTMSSEEESSTPSSVHETMSAHSLENRLTSNSSEWSYENRNTNCSRCPNSTENSSWRRNSRGTSSNFWGFRPFSAANCLLIYILVLYSILDLTSGAGEQLKYFLLLNTVQR